MADRTVDSLAILLASLITASCRGAAPPLVVRGDLDGDGEEEVAEVIPGADPFLTIRRGGEAVYRGLPGHWRPWRIAIGDVDGDGRPELALGIVKETKFFPFPHNCLFIYAWDGERLVPRWLGSSLSRPFSDFTLADVDGDRIDEVLAVESAPDNGSRVAVYSWAGFGFRLDWERAGLTAPRLLAAGPGYLTISDRGTVLHAAPPQGETD